MGSSQSSQKRTLETENPNPPQEFTRVIKITQDVANRIAKFNSDQQEFVRDEENKPNSESTQTQSNVINEPFQRPSSSQLPQPTPSNINEPVALSSGPYPYTVLETVTALQVRREKDQELNANDAFWRNKLKELEEKYANSAIISEKEFSTELEKLGKLLPKRGKPVCQDASFKVTECYKSNPNEVLKCSELVKAFSRCVEQTNVGKRQAA